MQQRRLRPGDVLDDYCPRERRVTDHAIVAMIDDTIQQTRCVVCDAEHEYKQAKVPAQRRKKTPALFTQVLDGLKAPARPAPAPELPDDAQPSLIDEPAFADEVVASVTSTEAAFTDVPRPAAPKEPAAEVGLAAVAPAASAEEPQPEPERHDGPFRRQLIRAALPRPEGITPPARVIPEFTIRQPMARPNRHGAPAGRRRGGQGHGQGQNGATRFGRGGQGQRFNGSGRSGGHGGHGANGNRAGGSRRGGKKR